MKDTLKQQKLAAKQRAIGVYQFYLARGFSSEEAQQMQVDHFNGRQVSTDIATHSPRLDNAEQQDTTPADAK